MRLTVCSVVPVICAMSCRLIGKSISMPCSTLRPDCLTSRSSAWAMRCSTCCGRHLHHARVGFLEAGADGLQRVGGERREFLHQPRPCPRTARPAPRCRRRRSRSPDSAAGRSPWRPRRSRRSRRSAPRSARRPAWSCWRGHGRAAARRTSARLRLARKRRLFLVTPDRAGFAQDRVEVGRRKAPQTAADRQPANCRSWPWRTSALRNLDREYRQRSSLNLRWRNECPPVIPVNHRRTGNSAGKRGERRCAR